MQFRAWWLRFKVFISSSNEIEKILAPWDDETMVYDDAIGNGFLLLLKP